jgi:gamma-glutamyltranspeptidase/glutathione hydrolase
MSPTLVIARGQPVLAIGAAGGPTIISQVVLAIINLVDFDLDLQAALATPRFHQQWQPDELRIEAGFGETVSEELQRRGHRVVSVRAIGASHAIARSSDGKSFVGVSEPRGYGKADGW